MTNTGKQADSVPVNEPKFDDADLQSVIDCIQSGWVSSEGPLVPLFEKRFAHRVGRSHGVAVCNGTAALDAAVEALKIESGDEVIMPAFTIISCIAQIVRSGALPVLVDSDPMTWNMNVSQIEERITPRTKAILAVHIYGLPVDMDPLLDIASRHGLKVIEDAAEVHGLTGKGLCGSFGNISTFSFYANKHVTTGEGGMLVTDEDRLAEGCRSLRNLCFQPERRFVHEQLGWNLRMTNLQAALGLAQLERLDELVARKRRMGRKYTEPFRYSWAPLAACRNGIRPEYLLGLWGGFGRCRAVHAGTRRCAAPQRRYRHTPVLLAHARAAGVSKKRALQRRIAPCLRTLGTPRVLCSQRRGSEQLPNGARG